MHRFYTPDIHFSETQYQLNKEEARHCIKSLRISTGERIILTDGKGTEFTGIINELHKKGAHIDIIKYEKKSNPLPYALHIAIAPPRTSSRFEWFLEKVTEIGVSEITPLICERSIKENYRFERLNKIIIAALKQSQKSYLPTLNPPKAFSNFIVSATSTEKYIAHCKAKEANHLINLYKKTKTPCILIGPEGDFTDEEIGLAQEQSFCPTNLGTSRLRTETAGVVVSSIIASLHA